EFNHRHVATLGEIAFLIEHIGDTARHARREVAAGLPDDHDNAAGHILAAMVAHTFDNRHRARVSHGKTLACHATEIALTFKRTIEHRIADDDGIFGNDTRVFRRTDDDATARKTLADIIIAVADQLERAAARQKRAEGLASRTAKRNGDGVFRQTLVAEAFCHLAGKHSTGRTVNILDLHVDLHRLAVFQRWHGLGNQLT